MSAADELAAVAAAVRDCHACPLGSTRRYAVPGEGPMDAEVVLIGEGPGFHEDRAGRPFVGPSGQLLEELLAGVGLRRDQVFLTNVVKCRPSPPDNRDPAPGEIAACAPYLERQIAAIDPRVIVTLGRFALARFVPGVSIGRVHGQPRQVGGRTVLPLFHPAFALRRTEMIEQLRDDFSKLPALLAAARSASDGGEPASEDEDSPQQLAMF